MLLDWGRSSHCCLDYNKVHSLSICLQSHSRSASSLSPSKPQVWRRVEQNSKKVTWFVEIFVKALPKSQLDEKQTAALDLQMGKVCVINHNNGVVLWWSQNKKNNNQYPIFPYLFPNVTPPERWKFNSLKADLIETCSGLISMFIPLLPGTFPCH